MTQLRAAVGKRFPKTWLGVPMANEAAIVCTRYRVPGFLDPSRVATYSLIAWVPTKERSSQSSQSVVRSWIYTILPENFLRKECDRDNNAAHQSRRSARENSLPAGFGCRDFTSTLFQSCLRCSLKCESLCDSIVTNAGSLAHEFQSSQWSNW